MRMADTKASQYPDLRRENERKDQNIQMRADIAQGIAESDDET